MFAHGNTVDNASQLIMPYSVDEMLGVGYLNLSYTIKALDVVTRCGKSHILMRSRFSS